MIKHNTAVTVVAQGNEPPKIPAPEQVSERATIIRARRKERDVSKAQEIINRVVSVLVVFPAAQKPEENIDAARDAKPPERHKAA